MKFADSTFAWIFMLHYFINVFIMIHLIDT